MIEKMKFLSITGPQNDIDRVVNQYLSKYEIQLENALSQLKTVKELRPFMEINPYREWLNKAREYAAKLSDDAFGADQTTSVAEAIQTIKALDEYVSRYQEQCGQLEEKRNQLKASLKQIEPFLSFPYNIHEIFRFRFIKYRFGKIARSHYDNFEKYVYDNLDTVFFKCGSDDQYIWGVYFVPATLADKVDAVYKSMHYERVHLPDEYQGTPEESIGELTRNLAKIEEQLKESQKELKEKLNSQSRKLLIARNTLETFSVNYDVRKLAARTKDTQGNHSFYILCGWMTEADAKSFQKEIESDENLCCILEDEENNILSQPPTKLKNPKIFRPFEMYIRMYGLPAYNELDPTIFVAITYSLIFGAMFGDVGQGLLLLIGGALLYKFKGMNLAAIVSSAGFCSTIFGFLYGSFFGFEDVLPALWLRPMDHMMTVPFIGKLNTVFIVAVAFGMFLILLAIVLHIINGIKAHDPESTWFDTNGVAGLVFYGSIVAAVFLYMTGHSLPATGILVVMFVVPLILIALKEPLGKLVQHKADYMPESKGMFLVQAFFELFEVLLSYFSNTISFVRVGAFAVSHAAMMQVVLMLAGAEAGSPNWIVIILGNLFVCGMEGLIVGIQVLRLEYYEMFSRFYKGTGREFTPFRKSKKA